MHISISSILTEMEQSKFLAYADSGCRTGEQKANMHPQPVNDNTLYYLTVTPVVDWETRADNPQFSLVARSDEARSTVLRSKLLNLDEYRAVMAKTGFQIHQIETPVGTSSQCTFGGHFGDFMIRRKQLLDMDLREERVSPVFVSLPA
jgi:hypothetical protein